MFSALLGLASLWTPDVSWAQSSAKREALLFVVHPQDEGAAWRAAQQETQLAWRRAKLLESAQAEESEPELPDAKAKLERLHGLYVEADFARCLSLLNDFDLQADEWLRRGQKREAAQILVLHAACALGAGELALVRESLERLFVAGLDPGRLRETTPELQRLAEEMAQEVKKRQYVELRIESSSTAGALLDVDGRRGLCAIPCTLKLRPGVHLIQARLLGYEDQFRVLQLAARPRTSVSFRLHRAAAATLKRQLAAESARFPGPDAEPFARALCEAEGTALALLVWRQDERVYAAMYDRKLAKFVLRSSAEKAEGASAESAVAAALREWRLRIQGKPLWKRPWFWVSVVGGAAAAALTVYFTTRPDERRFDLAFQ